MRWIDKALAELNDTPGGAACSDEPGRAAIAEAVLRALPRELVAAAIMSATHAVLVQRGISDGNNVLSRELGNNAAATVLLMLEVGE